MDVLVTTESRYFARPDGTWVSRDGTSGYPFWKRYLDVFDRVIVVARCSHEAVTAGVPVEGDGVELRPLSDANGAWGAVQRWRKWRHELRPLIRPSRAFILRLPGQIGWVLGQRLHGAGIPFGVEAVGDPAAVFGRDGFRHPLRPALRYGFSRMMRQMCARAEATSYVTAKQLQTKYPPNERATTTHYSSIELCESAFATSSRNYLLRPYPMHVINVATMSQRYKGQHDLIVAVGRCVSVGRPVQLALIGDGRFRSALEDQVRQARLTDRVKFMGRISAGAAIRNALEQSDVFVLPSLTEGLPRALIEAQARGLPCVATDVGGVSELLAPTECVRPGDPEQLAATLMSLLDDPHRLSRLSSENLERAHRFASPILRQRRTFFYQQVREATTVPRRVRRSRAA